MGARKKLDLDVTGREVRLIGMIVSRAYAALDRPGDFNRLTVTMDLVACHRNGCPLRLEELAEAATDANLLHDVLGIGRHIDRKTGQLRDCFLPRYAQ